MIRAYGPGQVPPLLDTIADIWSDAHPELVNTPGASTDGLSATALRRQVTSHLRHEGFTLVATYAHGTMVGFGYAFRRTPEYWYGPELPPEIPEHVRAGRLMGLCELAVTPVRQFQGIDWTDCYASADMLPLTHKADLLLEPDGEPRSIPDHLVGEARERVEGAVRRAAWIRREARRRGVR